MGHLFYSNGLASVILLKLMVGYSSSENMCKRNKWGTIVFIDIYLVGFSHSTSSRASFNVLVHTFLVLHHSMGCQVPPQQDQNLNKSLKHSLKKKELVRCLWFLVETPQSSISYEWNKCVAQLSGFC